ncbi:MAG: hypothetical protein M1458_02210 [Deltaproteobacteria bacterium]|nr:hypothetical protein [Deltaproteobacteria bacterium]
MKVKLKNSKGIAMVAVLLTIAILGILAAIALQRFDYNIVNAGQNTTTEYAHNTSDSGINIILPVIASGGTIGGVTINPINSSQTIIGDYYYTMNNTLNNNQTTYVNLGASDLLSSSVSQNILGDTTMHGPRLGFEYSVTNCWQYVIGQTIQYYYYTGFINVISRDNPNSKPVISGANFTYGINGDIKSQPANCSSPIVPIVIESPPFTPTPDPFSGDDLAITSWYQLG